MHRQAFHASYCFFHQAGLSTDYNEEAVPSDYVVYLQISLLVLLPFDA